MADDPNKKRIDAWTFSSQAHEHRYLESKFKVEFPSKSVQEIGQAIFSCGLRIAPSEGRRKLEACVRTRLRS